MSRGESYPEASVSARSARAEFSQRENCYRKQANLPAARAIASTVERLALRAAVPRRAARNGQGEGARHGSFVSACPARTEFSQRENCHLNSEGIVHLRKR